MANIRIDLVEQLVDGHSVTFKAPCDCTAIDGLKVYYPTENGIKSDIFALKDAHGNNVAGLGNLFGKGAYVKVILGVADKAAYIQNADTNSYIEGRLADIKSTTETTIKGCTEGELILKNLVGNTVQKSGTSKNILPSKGLTTQTIESVTFTPEHGTSGELLKITVNGTATGDAVYEIGELLGVNGNYYVCGNPSDVGDQYGLSYRVCLESAGSNYGDQHFIADCSNNNGSPVGLSGDFTWNMCVSIFIPTGATVTNMVVYPMVCKNDVTDFTYEPWLGGQYPNPLFPQAIENTFDCVEMIGGYYNNGVYTVGSGISVCSKRHIPCTSGDVLKLETEIAVKMVFSYYKNGVFVSRTTAMSDYGNLFTSTVPSGIDSFVFNMSTASTKITPETVGKITLTVNGKYVGQIVEHGKNIINIKKSTFTESGVTLTNNGDGSFTVNGTATARVISTLVKDAHTLLEVGKNYRIVGCPNGGSHSTYGLIDTFNSVFTDYGNGKTFTNDGKTMYIAIDIKQGTVCNNLVFKPMLVDADLFPDATYDDFEPYTEKITTFFLNEPLRATDRIVRKDGVWYEEHKRKHYIVSIKGINTSSKTGNKSAILEVADKTKTTNSNSFCDKATYSNNGESGTYVENTANFVIYGEPEDTLETMKTKYDGAIIEYNLATPTLTPLDTASQIALNGLETFKDVTYLEVDSKIKPTSIEMEYAASDVVAMVLKHERKLNDLFAYVDIDFSGEKIVYSIAPPPGFTIDNSVVIAYDHFVEGETQTCHNHVRGTDLTDGSTFLAQLTFMKNPTTGGFAIWTSQMDAFSDDQAALIRCEFTGTLRVYFQRIS